MHLPIMISIEQVHKTNKLKVGLIYVWNETRILYWNKYDRIDIILEKLRDYTVKHFADEEQYMESINYKKLFTQKTQHQEFIYKIDEFMEHHNDEVEDQDEQIMGILKYLTEWLVNHILYVDGQIPKGWYSKKGCYFLE